MKPSRCHTVGTGLRTVTSLQATLFQSHLPASRITTRTTNRTIRLTRVTLLRWATSVKRSPLVNASTPARRRLLATLVNMMAVYVIGITRVNRILSIILSRHFIYHQIVIIACYVIKYCNAGYSYHTINSIQYIENISSIQYIENINSKT